MKVDRTFLILAGFLLAALLLWLSAEVGVGKEQARVPRVDSNTPSGLRVFTDLKSHLAPRSSLAGRRPILTLEDLKPYSTYFITAPRISPTVRELKLIREWTEAGGNLVLTIEDEAQHQALRELYRESGISDLIDDAPGFKNGEAVQLNPKKTSPLYKENETYEAYSRLRFKDFSCLDDPSTCYSREGHLGLGTIQLFLGLPPFGNVLIERAENKKLAARLALATHKSLFDEYHLLITEKTNADLWTDPAFILPIFGFIIGILLYFTLGGESDEEQRLSRQQRPRHRQSLGDFGKRVVEHALASPGAMKAATARHAKFLKSIIPKNQPELITATEAAAAESRDSDVAQSQAALNLTKAHQLWLKSRGRK